MELPVQRIFDVCKADKTGGSFSVDAIMAPREMLPANSPRGF